jgi:putative addiction module component (TIGR02574 family)
MKVMERNTTQLREELHQYISQADDRFVQLIYAMVQADKKEQELLSQEEKEELERRVERHKNGQSKSYSWEEVKARLRKQA